MEQRLDIKLNYNGLWKKLIDKDLLRKDITEKKGINSSTLAKMSKGEPVSLTVLVKICDLLQCDIGDIVSIKQDKEA